MKIIGGTVLKNSGSKFMADNIKYHFYILLTSKVYKKDVTEKSLIYQAFLHISAMYFKPIFKDVKKAFFLKIGFEPLQNIFLRYFESSFSKIALFFVAKILPNVIY